MVLDLGIDARTNHWSIGTSSTSLSQCYDFFKGNVFIYTERQNLFGKDGAS